MRVERQHYRTTAAAESVTITALPPLAGGDMPVARLITARGCPIIFATGYGLEGVPEEFRDLPGAAEALPAQGPGNLDRWSLSSARVIARRKYEIRALTAVFAAMVVSLNW
jgi:hypothetical protein